MPIIITCKKPGFRRCGIAHPAGPVEYPDNRFTAAELKRLKIEPKLIVQIVENGDKKSSQKDFEKFTIDGLLKIRLEGNLGRDELGTIDYPLLKKLAENMNLKFKSNIKKTDLIELIASEPVFAEKTENINPKSLDKNEDQQNLTSADQVGADQ